MKIMWFINGWVHTRKKPVPHQKILKEMQTQGVKIPTTIKALSVLLRKGYIRRAIGVGNRTYYVMLRTDYEHEI